jgi:hypothetical protein
MLGNDGKYRAATIAIAGFAIATRRSRAVEPTARAENKAGLGITAVGGVVE